MARQAYDFYQEYQDEGKDYNGDVYAGIYTALQGLYQVKYNEIAGIEDPTIGDSALNQLIKPKDPMVEDKANAVKSVVYANDGKHIYSANANGEVVLWDVATREFKTIFTNADVARVVNVSPDERYLALGTDESHILLFNMLALDQEPVEIKGHEGGTVFDLIFLPNNQGFISVGQDKRILQSDYQTSREIVKSSVRLDEIILSPDAKTLVGGGHDGNVYIWDMENLSAAPNKLVDPNRSTSSSSAIRSVKFSPSGKYLAYGDSDGKIIVWDMEKDKQVQPEIGGFRAPVTDLEFSPDNRLLVATSTNKQVRVWDMENLFDLPIVLRDYSNDGGQLGWVYDADFSPDGKYFVTAAGDGAIRKYPTNIDEMADQICANIDSGKGNLSPNEWGQYVGADIEYQTTCEGMEQRR